MTDPQRQKLIELLQEAQSLADRLGEGIALYLIRNAIMELEQNEVPKLGANSRF